MFSQIVPWQFLAALTVQAPSLPIRSRFLKLKLEVFTLPMFQEVAQWLNSFYD